MGTIGRKRLLILSCALLLGVILQGRAAAQAKAPKPGSRQDREVKAYLKAVRPSSALSPGWMVETESYVLHSTISKEYTAAAAFYLGRFQAVFRSIFWGEFKDTRKPVAYAFATEKEYLKFSPRSAGTQGRFLTEGIGRAAKKDLAWYSTPLGERDFFKSEVGVLQHEATHQLIDAYTGNQSVPTWFHEGCATFFESWDLEKKNPENILSGLKGRYALGTSLSYPTQDHAPPLAEFWIQPRDLLVLDHRKVPVFPPIPREPVKKRSFDADFREHMRLQQEYNEAWCAMTFLIDHKKGQEVFKLFVREFREGKNFEAIRKKYYDENFLGSFEREWSKFIETKVLGKWELPTVGGRTLRPGDGRPPPESVSGFPLTGDRRGDMFLVEAESRELAIAGEKNKVWMLKAWSIPVRFYDEAWKLVPDLLAKERTQLAGGIYGMGVFADRDNSTFQAVFLVPAWLQPPDRKTLSEGLSKAVVGLVIDRR